MMRSLRRGTCAFAALLFVVALSLTGCRNIGDYALPGGNARGAPYEVTVIFDDVLSLEQQSAVRVDDVPIGDVNKIDIRGFKAYVRLRIKKDTVLPANTVAELRQTSLFGEKFVSLSPPPPPEQPYGRLQNGAVIDRSGRNPETEEVLAALSALLNGGGVEQLQTISVELSNALAGRESAVRDALRQLNSFVGALDDRKQEIVRALEGIDRLAARLARQKATIENALDNIPPALAVLADQRSQLTRMLTSLSHLGVVSDDVIKNSRANTVALLRELQPVLGSLDSAKTNIVKSLELLVSYPFPTTVNSGVHGDYAGLYATLNLNVSDLIKGLSTPQAPQGTTCPAGTTGVTPPACLPSSGGTSSSQLTQPQLQQAPQQQVVPNLPNTGLTQQSVSSPSGSDYTRIMMQGTTK